MSDVEEKKSGYRLEYAKNNRAKCKGMFIPLVIYRPFADRPFYAFHPQGRSLAPVSRSYYPEKWSSPHRSVRHRARKGYTQGRLHG
jgi:hypothetical protein